MARSLHSSPRADKTVYMAKGGRRPRCFEAGGILCGHRARAVMVLSPACRETLLSGVAEACRGLWRAGYITKGVRPVR